MDFRYHQTILSPTNELLTDPQPLDGFLFDDCDVALSESSDRVELQSDREQIRRAVLALRLLLAEFLPASREFHRTHRSSLPHRFHRFHQSRDQNQAFFETHPGSRALLSIEFENGEKSPDFQSPQTLGISQLAPFPHFSVSTVRSLLQSVRIPAVPAVLPRIPRRTHGTAGILLRDPRNSTSRQN